MNTENNLPNYYTPPPPGEVTLERSGQYPLRFTGERISSVSGTSQLENDEGEDVEITTYVNLYKTNGGRFVVAISKYDETNEACLRQSAEVRASLAELVDVLKEAEISDGLFHPLFERTEIADQFIERID